MRGDIVDSDRPRVTVIVPHLNTPALLARCLASVTVQQLDHGIIEIIVVDNGSQTPLDAVKATYPMVTFAAEPVPGPGLARNRGAALASAPVLAFIDADCRAAPGWLQAAVAAVEPDPARLVAGGEIRVDAVDPRRMTGIEAYEAVFGFRQRWYISKKHFSVTANLAMGAPVLQAVGPFAGIDTAEDYDWGRRGYRLGYPTRYVAAMRVFHPARPDFDSMARKWRRLIDHQFRAHTADGQPLWRWHLRAVLLVGAVPVEAVKMFTSQRLSGLANRCRGVGALARVRYFRAAEMLQVARGDHAAGALAWNRNP